MTSVERLIAAVQDVLVDHTLGMESLLEHVRAWQKKEKEKLDANPIA